MLVNARSELLREPNLLLPGKKPVGPVKIDWSHPLSRDLHAAVVKYEPFDLVGNALSSTGTASPNVENIIYNGTQVFLVKGNGDSTLLLDCTAVDNKSFTFVMRFAETAVSSPYVGIRSGDGNSILLWGTTGRYYDLRVGSTNYVSGPGFSQNVTHNYSVTSSASEVNLIADGDYIIDSGAAGGAGNLGVLHIGRDSVYSGGGMDLNIEYLYVFNYAMTFNEISLIHNDPYQFLIPA